MNIPPQTAFEKLKGRLPSRIKYKFGICQDFTCGREGIPCFMPDNKDDEKPDNYYCVLHAHKWGHCWSCGQFWGGIESFDFGPDNLCENCREEFEDEYMKFDDESVGDYDVGFGGFEAEEDFPRILPDDQMDNEN